MIQALLPGALTYALLTSTTFTAPVNSSAQFQSTSPVKELKLIWVVKPGETLLTIADEYYGDEKFWTTLWNDNPSITDPNAISVNDVLSVRNVMPKEQEEISPTLKTTYPNISYAFISPEVPVVAPTTAVTPSSTPVEVASTPIPTITPQPITSATSGPLTDAQLTFLGTCEAGMTANRNSGNGYYGAFQFSIGTWNSMNTGYERADLAPIEVQKDAVQRLLSRSSIYTQFPGCARKMQAAGLL